MAKLKNSIMFLKTSFFMSNHRQKISTKRAVTMQHLRKPIGPVINETKRDYKITNTGRSQNFKQFYDTTVFKALCLSDLICESCKPSLGSYLNIKGRFPYKMTT